MKTYPGWWSMDQNIVGLFRFAAGTGTRGKNSAGVVAVAVHVMRGRCWLGRDRCRWCKSPGFWWWCWWWCVFCFLYSLLRCCIALPMLSYLFPSLLVFLFSFSFSFSFSVAAGAGASPPSSSVFPSLSLLLSSSWSFQFKLYQTIL